MMLIVNKIDTYYSEFQAVKQASLTVNEGALVALFGPNGHGKSTLLKTICGLLTPTSGSVEFKGRDITRLKAKKIVEKGLVYIPEDPHLFPEMSVLENLKLGAFNLNARKKEDENLEFVYELFPRLKEWRKHTASTLSGGERQMLALGRGLMSSASFLAIDEPSLGLAPKLRDEVFKRICEIHRSGLSLLMVDQNTIQASELVDRIYIMEEGKIVFEGDKEEVLQNEQLKETFLGM